MQAAIVAASRVVELHGVDFTAASTDGNVKDVIAGWVQGHVADAVILNATAVGKLAVVECDQLAHAVSLVRACGQARYSKFQHFAQAHAELARRHPGLVGTDASSLDSTGAPLNTSVILVNVVDPLMPLHADIFHAVFSRIGPVARVAINRKMGVQAFVEFTQPEHARTAIDQLSGAELYPGCCRLHLEPSKSTRINMKMQDFDHRQYAPAVLDGEDTLSHAIPMAQSMSSSSSGIAQIIQQPTVHNSSPSVATDPDDGTQLGYVHFSGLPTDMTAVNIRNLFSMYGRVSRVLITEPGSGVAEVVTAGEAVTLCTYLDGTNSISVKAAAEPGFPDGSSPLAFDTDRTAPRAHARPTACLHFRNAPPALGESEMTQILQKCGVRPAAISVFPDNAKTSSGLVQFKSVMNALRAAAALNRVTLQRPQKGIFTLRVAFSANRLPIAFTPSRA